MGIAEVWISYGVSDKTIFMAVHKLSVALGQMKSKAILKSHV